MLNRKYPYEGAGLRLPGMPRLYAYRHDKEEGAVEETWGKPSEGREAPKKGQWAKIAAFQSQGFNDTWIQMEDRK